MAMSEGDKQWETEADARSLVEARLVRGDPKRWAKAIAHIKKENAARKEAIKP
ncbi:hypothetical protein LCGC14_2394070 [marine sediment metagenome]|uniref:Uncharacterized protein n=1 Tax=marine sediment metagenome TaxID=412755 RepID=A0A0F9E9M7_9ZZZZ